MAEYKFPFDANAEEFRNRITEFAQTQRGRMCDKCRMPVPPQNDAGVFDFINHLGNPLDYLILGNRHLEPVADKQGVIVCEGSPSRWQDISGVPDPRPEYHRETGIDVTAVAIWQLMQTFGFEEIENPHRPIADIVVKKSNGREIKRIKGRS